MSESGQQFMVLRGVTLTGIDERTDLEKLRKLTQRYRFVEWGFLVSPKRTGLENRYPSLDLLSDLLGKGYPIALHLCGEYSDMAATDESDSLPISRNTLRKVRRIQVNLGRRVQAYPDLPVNLHKFAMGLDVQTILQTSTFNVECLQYYRSQKRRLPSGVSLLHDPSGGRGIRSSFEAPVNDEFTGYAGGFSPENVQDVVSEIERFPARNDYWIDMESCIRTDDWLDLSKCEAVLKSLETYTGDYRTKKEARERRKREAASKPRSSGGSENNVLPQVPRR